MISFLVWYERRLNPADKKIGQEPEKSQTWASKKDPQPRPIAGQHKLKAAQFGDIIWQSEKLQQNLLKKNHRR